MRNILILTLALSLSLVGCAQQGGTTPPEQVQEQPSPEQAAPEATPEAAGPAPEDGSVPEGTEWLNVMPSVMEAIVLAMGTESSIAYDPADPDFFWTALHTIAVQSGQLFPDITADEAGVTVPGPALDKIAGVAFAEYGELPPIPESMEDMIAYDGAAGAYRFTPADMGDTYAQMETGERNGDGKMAVTVGLYRSATVRLGGIVFTLCDNPHSGAAEDPMYELSVESARNEIDLGLSRWQGIDPARGAELQAGAESIAVAIRYQEEAGALELSFAFPGGELQEEIEYLYDPSFHLADTDLQDGYTELYISGDMGSSDYVTYIYRAVEGGLQKSAIPGSVDSLNSLGNLLVSTNIDVLGTHAATAQYAMQEDFSLSLSGSYTTAATPNGWEYQAITLSKDGLPMVNLMDNSAAEGREGDRFLLMATDLETYAALMAEDGATYAVEIARSEDHGWEIAGEPEGEWFEELNYAG